MLSSANLQWAMERCRALGATYVRKPVRRGDLAQSLGQANRPEPASPSKVAQVPVPLDDEPPGRRLRVLVVEDNPFNQRVAVMKLGRKGHEVQVAACGADALAALDTEWFDVMFSDIQMPDMDGFELAAAVRKREAGSGRRLPVIAMTAHAMKGDESRCLAAGMDAYVPKPVKPDALFAVLERVVPAPAQAAPAAEPGTLRRLTDWAEALSHVRGDEDLLRELAGIFVDEWPRWHAALRDGLANNDAGLVQRTAHTVKGSLGTFAAATAHAAAWELEKRAGDGSLADGPAALDGLEHQVNALLPPLAAFAKGGPP
jgi:CheY-like chemotaxis protein/HPt (histidine-containing phosphotransfer) domain-containing protein